MQEIRSKVEEIAEREVVARMVACGRATLGRGLPAQSESSILRRLRCVALSGLIAQLGRRLENRDALDGWLQKICDLGAHPHDAPAQSVVLETAFDGLAHEVIVVLASRCEPMSRSQVRELLAVHLVALAQGLLAVLEAPDTDRHAVLQEFRSPPEDVDDLRQFVQPGPAAPRLPAGYGNGRWDTLRRAPLIAVLHVSAASANGPAGLINEFRAANREVIDRALHRNADSFIGALFHSGLCRHRLRQLADQHLPAADLMVGLHRAVSTFDNVSALEGHEYRQIIDVAAEAAANAAREPVLFARRWHLEDEQWALDEIRRLIHGPADHRPGFIFLSSA